MSKVKNVILNIITFILVIIAIIVIYAFIQSHLPNNSYINLLGYSFFRTDTGSMSNTIEIGDIVVVKIGKYVKEDDIITYFQNNSIITHRVVEIDGDRIITKGDNNNAPDASIGKEQIIGKVVYIIHNVEVWRKVFTDPKVIIPIVGTVILLVVLISYKEKKEKKNEDKDVE